MGFLKDLSNEEFEASLVYKVLNSVELNESEDDEIKFGDFDKEDMILLMDKLLKSETYSKKLLSEYHVPFITLYMIGKSTELGKYYLSQRDTMYDFIVLNSKQIAEFFNILINHGLGEEITNFIAMFADNYYSFSSYVKQVFETDLNSIVFEDESMNEFLTKVKVILKIS